MKQSTKFSVSVLCVAVLLSMVTGVAQSRFPQEAGRGFPYSSREEWWPVLIMLILLIILGIIISIAGKILGTLADHSRWHTLAVIVATVFSALLLSAASHANVDYPPTAGLVLFMLIPSFMGIGLLYLAIMRVVQIRQDRVLERSRAARID